MLKEPLRNFSNNLPLELKPIVFVSNTIGEYMRFKLLLWKWLSQKVNNIKISGHFFYDYITLTNDFSDQVVYFSTCSNL